METDNNALTGAEEYSEQPAKRLISFSGLNRLHHFNPFTRRKSSYNTSTHDEPTTDTMIASGEAASVGSSGARKPKRIGQNADTGHNTPTSMNKSRSSRRGSWLPLPENPSRPLSRSSTIGNISLPTRFGRQVSGATVSSRQSSAASTQIPKNQSQKQSLRSRIPSAPKSILKSGKVRSLPRSDTEPLLPLAGDLCHIPILPRSLPSQKENVAPTARESQSKTFEAQHPSVLPQSRSIKPFSPLHGTPTQIQKIGIPPKPRLVDVPRRSLPRWSTQPTLPSLTTSKSEVKHHALLTPKHPPTPEQPTSLPTLNIPRNFTTPRALQSPPIPLSDTSSLHSPNQPDRISTAESIPYWCGRFAALHDRLRTEAVHATLCPLERPTSPSPAQDCRTSRSQRTQTVFALLYAACNSPAATESLRLFWTSARMRGAKFAVGDEQGMADVEWGEVVRRDEDAL
ncbi:hypothetical protein K461DRAFT_115503 [Myriangium duriaei CBS 260.36]|uniref:Uncharacterized protein n=1 Tax=Myriangium duriaei CBS 260.36 TaxID=1168546 RepID=A0A9P4J240_9PEZI|nr:hypothetical protein K461DRAFT_115503 [Myriangium duriaei CBS 260.36]